MRFIASPTNASERPFSGRRLFSFAFVLRRSYRIDMSVSGQARDAALASERGPRARMRRHMLSTAIRLMQDGFVPSVSDVAEAAEVSRATAYRYYPSQAALVQAVVDEALGPILAWRSTGDDAEQRVSELLGFAFPRMLEYEATHRAALSQALDQWIRRQAGTLGPEPRIVRGNRRGLLRGALAPLSKQVPAQTFDKLTQSLSLIFGIEAIIVLKDIWGMDDDDVREVAEWAAQALVAAAVAEASTGKRAGNVQTIKKNAAGKPRATRARRKAA
jgi:AcrR family transcriptional regulator